MLESHAWVHVKRISATEGRICSIYSLTEYMHTASLANTTCMYSEFLRIIWPALGPAKVCVLITGLATFQWQICATLYLGTFHTILTTGEVGGGGGGGPD